jgi:electron-transferring-flavoprotein dehydrogenase
MRVRPDQYPPPFSEEEAITLPTDPEGERIEVGVLVVGAGPAGLACAIRLGQLLERSPEVRDRLGDVPVAVVEKGRQPGSHLLSGAIVNPRSLLRLFNGRIALEEVPLYGEVAQESTYFLTQRRALRLPTVPAMRNGGNYIASLSELGRWLSKQAEEVGATVLPETTAAKLLVENGCVSGVRTGDKGRDRDGEPGPRFEPGGDILAGVTVLAEGTQGYLTTAVIDRFGLEGPNPQVWSLGVKEVWRVPKAVDGVIHTVGWPLRSGARYREFGGSFIYPMGAHMVAVGMVVGLDYRDAELSVHDLLQELKTHPFVRDILSGGERLAWGAKTIPEGGFYSLPKRLHAPGVLIVGDGAGMVNMPALKGVHYAIESGRLAAEAIFSALEKGVTTPIDDLAHFDASVRESFIWSDLVRVRNVRQAFGRGLWVGGALAAATTVSKGIFPPWSLRTKPDAEHHLIKSRRASDYPPPDGTLTFDKVSSVFLSGNQTPEGGPNNIRLQRRVPRELGQMWVWMCPAEVYELVPGDGSEVTVRVTPTNCVQCGAITAKGGRLTPPEGGFGPEYTLT